MLHSYSFLQPSLDRQTHTIHETHHQQYVLLSYLTDNFNIHIQSIEKLST